MASTPLTGERIASLQADPKFDAAVATSMRGTIALHRGRGFANWILNDRARALFGHLLLYLYFTGRPDDPASGLTAARVKQTAVEAGICSAGRAFAMLSLMRGTGFIAAGPEVSDRRFRRLVPTEKLLELQRERFRYQFEAMAALLPDARRALPLLGRGDLESALVRALGSQFLSGTRLLSHTPELEPFAEYSAGMVVLFGLMLATEAGGTFVLDRPIAISISELAVRYRVSRTQILRLLRQAEEAAFLARTGSNYENVVLLLKLQQNLWRMSAAIFLFLADAAAKAMSEIENAVESAGITLPSSP